MTKIILLHARFKFQEAERLEPSEDQTTYNYIDYSDKRSLPISIPDYHTVDKDGDKYVVSKCNFFYVIIAHDTRAV